MRSGLLYYQEKGYEPVYVTEAEYTGDEELDVERMLQPLPDYWEKIALSPQQKKKTLVLTDWTAYRWSQEKIEKVKATFKDLLAKDFKIYLWQQSLPDGEGKVVPLTLEYLDQTLMLKAITPKNEEDIIKITAKKCQLVPEAIQLLDDYWLQVLIDNPDSLTERELDIANISNHPDSSLIYPILSHLKPPISQIINTEFPISETHQSALKTELPNIPIINNYKHLTIDALFIKNNKDFFTNLINNKIATTNDGQVVTLDLMLNIESLKLVYCKKTPALGELITSLKLKNLSFDEGSLSWWDYFTEGPGHSVSSLKIKGISFEVEGKGKFAVEVLSLVSNAIETKDFIKLIDRSPHLKTVNLINVKKLKIDDPSVLEILRLRNIDVTVDHQSLADYLSLQKVKDKKNAYHDRSNSRDFQHDPSYFLRSSPPPDIDDFNFEFVGDTETKDQGMIKEKLAQYLTFQSEDLASQNENKKSDLYRRHIWRLATRGICSPLAKLFQEKSLKDWDDLIDTVKRWNGERDSLNNKLRNYFIEINTKFERYYADDLHIHTFIKEGGGNVWLGDDFSAFLREQINNRKPDHSFSFILCNPWHTITIKCEHNTWYIYDPNFQDGRKQIAPENLAHLSQQIKNILGNIIFVKKQSGLTYPKKLKISDSAKFINEGGLLSLLHDSSSEDLEKIIEKISSPDELKKLSLETLQQGLLLRNLKCIPAWAAGLKSTNSRIRGYFCKFIERFVSLTPKNYHTIFAESISELSSLEQHEIKTRLLQYLNIQLIDDLKPESKVEPTLKVKLKTTSPTMGQKISDAIYEKKEKHLARRFKTWKQSSLPYDSIEAFCSHLVSGKARSVPANTGIQINGKDQNKWLVQLDSVEAVETMSLQLQKFCKGDAEENQNRRPFYYIHSPDEIVCKARYIEKHPDGTGSIEDGPGGPLYKFLTTEHKLPPVIIVNYDRFNADDLVRLNSLLDKNPKADGIDLPKETVVVGLINPHKPNCYKGEDFYSRFGIDGILSCPFSLPETVPSIYELHPNEVVPSDKVSPINLFNARNWRQRLLGGWVTHKGKPVFKEGLLKTALKDNRPILLQNGPWDDRDFKYFWSRAESLGYIEWKGEKIDISKHTFLQKNGYEWEDLKETILNEKNEEKEIFAVDRHFDPKAQVLNPTLLGRFFKQYDCDEVKPAPLDVVKGFIGKAREAGEQVLSVNVTRDLSVDEWAMLLTECKEHQIKLECHLAPHVNLPAELPIKLNLDPISLSYEPATRIIQTTDIDVTVQQLADNNWEVIDVSECSPSDLLTKLEKVKNAENLDFSFIKRPGVLHQAISDEKQIILKGKFSQAMADSLAPLILKNEVKLNIVSENASLFKYMPIKDKRITWDEKLAILNKDYEEKVKEHEEKVKQNKFQIESSIILPPSVLLESSAIENIDLENESLSQLRARISYAELHAELANLPEKLLINTNPWQGLKGILGKIQLEAFDKENSAIIADAFEQKRLRLINAMLTKRPFVFLTGISGVGKTTFVKNNFKDAIFYKNESHLKEWAKDKEGKTLFIDEANLSSKDWSQFEGLFSKPKSIIINNVKYPLTENHKVIFAGNPLNYGSNRKMASFFERHGGALIFEPMPQEYIYERILKPIFAGTVLKDPELILKISEQLLARYRFICECSEDEILISPRELQMIALLIISHVNNNPGSDTDLDSITDHYASLITRNLVPEKDRKRFDDEFPKLAEIQQNPKVIKIKKEKQTEFKEEEFVVTQSRWPVYQYLLDLIKLRDYRRELHRFGSDDKVKLYGGLGGMIVEGEPGIGKSDLVMAALIEQGFTEIKNLKIHSSLVPDKAFYHMPNNLPLKEKEELLKKAFKEGAIVVIDEINSSPMPEGLLNELLMGELEELPANDALYSDAKSSDAKPFHPDDLLIKPQDKEKRKPGFMVIGTQNPIHMGGRYSQSVALKRRLTMVPLPPYPTNELVSILENKKMAKKDAQRLVEIYQAQLGKAKERNRSPIPTFRTLIEVAEEEIESALINNLGFTHEEVSLLEPEILLEQEKSEQLKNEAPKEISSENVLDANKVIDANNEVEGKKVAKTSDNLINQLTDDLINAYETKRDQNHLLSCLNQEPFQNIFEKFKEDKDSDGLWDSLVDLCNRYQKKTKDPSISLFCRAIIEWVTNVKMFASICTIKQLLIAQQKRDAIKFFTKEVERLAGEAYFLEDEGLITKYHAYQNLGSEILISDKDVTLSDLVLQDGAVMKKPVMMYDKAGNIIGECTLPGKADPNIQEALYYRRGLGITEATSERKLKKFRNELISIDDVMPDGDMEEKPLWPKLPESPDHIRIREENSLALDNNDKKIRCKLIIIKDIINLSILPANFKPGLSLKTESVNTILKNILIYLDPGIRRDAARLLETKKTKPNLLGNNYKSNYEQELICRAIKSLNLYLKHNILFESLEELLNFQQKQDVLNLIIKNEKKVSDKKEKTAYNNLNDAIKKHLNDHTKTIKGILGDKNRNTFKFFTKKFAGIHPMRNAGDFFNDMCHLPRPFIFLANMTKQSKSKNEPLAKEMRTRNRAKIIK